MSISPSKWALKEMFLIKYLKAVGNYLAYEDGRSFFYLGDTAWELFHKLTHEEIDFYIGTRARHGYNVIQAVALSEFDGLMAPNAYGRLPLKAGDGGSVGGGSDVGGSEGGNGGASSVGGCGVGGGTAR